MSDPEYVDLTGCEFRREAYTDEEWVLIEMMQKHFKRTFDDVDAMLEKEGKLNRYERFNLSGALIVTEGMGGKDPSSKEYE